MDMIRTLRADEIECRVGAINEKGLSLLLYKDARVDQKILDEAYGAMNWKRSHQQIGGSLYCTVEIWDKEKGQWIAKQDVGTASYSDAEKGLASDSFKRACFNWGIGRELYTAPFIWISAEKVKIEPKGQGRDMKYHTNERFSVKSIDYAGRAVSSLAVVNSRGQEVYSWSAPDQASPRGLTPYQKTALGRELVRTGISLDKVLERYGLTGVEQMTQEAYEDAMKGLKKSASRRKAA